ncbi:hypothetical protein CCHR01_15374 [Colletotrichum chrysophilum]|uniref:Uncharacterized protein n=1 Tax=Colletotrichum chrysophilum TaxID=1836956 RepID=A0AAD9A6B2_9PEZI|nr:hypothetical protein CCHR01_15374 [Colletotrichum chrysophilum]
MMDHSQSRVDYVVERNLEPDRDFADGLLVLALELRLASLSRAHVSLQVKYTHLYPAFRTSLCDGSLSFVRNRAGTRHSLRTTPSTKRRKSPSQGGKEHKNDTRKHRNLRSWTTHSLSRPRGTHIRFTTHTINPFSLFSSPFLLSPLFVTCSTACSRQQHFTALDEIMMTEPTYRRTLLVINTPQSLGHVKWGNRRPRLGLLPRRLVEGFHLSLLIHVIFRPFLCNCPLNVFAPGCWRKGGREEGEDGSMRSGRPCIRDTYFAIFFSEFEYDGIP